MKLLALAIAVALTACGSGPGFHADDDAGTTGGDDAAVAKDSATTKDAAGSDANAPGDAGATGSPTLEIVSGDGDTVPSGWPATDPLRVRARDGQGNLVANADVAYTVGASQSLHLQMFGPTATTDANGIASVTYNAFPINGWLGYEADTVTASWNGATATFHVIITQVPSGAWAAPPLFDIQVPDTTSELGSVKAGTTIPGAFQIVGVFQQGPSYGQGVPGWGFRLTSSSDLLSPADVSCAGGTALADSQGNLTCDLVVPSTPGDYYFAMLAGGQIRWDGHVKAVP